MINMILSFIMYCIKGAGVFLWPEVCPFCGNVSRRGICDCCRKTLDALKIKNPKCMQCGKPVRFPEQEYCYDCMHAAHLYDRGLGLWIHREPVNQSIYQFKYHNQRRFCKYYAEEIIRAHCHVIKKWDPDLILPIPLHRRRRKERGYNQAALISREIGRLLGIPVDEKSLVRSIYTNPQKRLGRGDRKRNLNQVFALKKDFLPVPVILLVDDIYTTGSTIDAAAGVLKKKGVEKVYFLTISIGQGY